MKTEKLVAALRRMKVETGSIMCLGCGREYACGIHGCAVMRDAAGKIEELVERCARYAEEIAVLRERRKRVPVVKRLPERDGKYLCWYRLEPHQNVLFCQVLDYYATDPNPHFQHEGMNGMTVTHWMEISEEQA